MTGLENAGRKEIIQLTFNVAQWDCNMADGIPIGPATGAYQLPFSVNLPDWLPDSMVLGEPTGCIMMRVEYRITA